MIGCYSNSKPAGFGENTWEILTQAGVDQAGFPWWDGWFFWTEWWDVFDHVTKHKKCFLFESTNIWFMRENIRFMIYDILWWFMHWLDVFLFVVIIKAWCFRWFSHFSYRYIGCFTKSQLWFSHCHFEPTPWYEFPHRFGFISHDQRCPSRYLCGLKKKHPPVRYIYHKPLR